MVLSLNFGEPLIASCGTVLRYKCAHVVCSYVTAVMYGSGMGMTGVQLNPPGAKGKLRVHPSWDFS